MRGRAGTGDEGPRSSVTCYRTPGFPHGDGDCPGPCDCGTNPCGEYLFNYVSNVSGLADFIVDEFILGPTGEEEELVGAH